MTRWSGAEEGKVELEMLSDYRSHDFGKNYGVYIKELALLARATFVIDKEGIVRYAEIVPEIASEPTTTRRSRPPRARSSDGAMPATVFIWISARSTAS